MRIHTGGYMITWKLHFVKMSGRKVVNNLSQTICSPRLYVGNQHERAKYATLVQVWYVLNKRYWLKQKECIIVNFLKEVPDRAVKTIAGAVQATRWSSARNKSASATNTIIPWTQDTATPY